ncbi:MAG: hypothetical protein KDI01_04625 [Halioglobus sp.]|nr:hypothetical protein [Halioglobus sp.]
MINQALQNWRSGQASLGAWSNLSDIHLAETLGRMGFDWLCFDLQHGLMDYSHLPALLPAVTGLPVTPLVRVAANQPEQIGKALDAGAQGVIVPMVNTAEEALRAVAACRYPPDGNRSCGPLRDAMIEGFEYLNTANQQIACIAMIETEEGLDNVEAIAAVPGLDALFVGPMDLCYGLGLPPGDFDNASFKAAIVRILGAAAQHGIASGMFGYSPEMAHAALNEGFNFASAGTDVSFFRKGAQQALNTARGASSEDQQRKAVY